mgnify:CR=1 FL=1
MTATTALSRPISRRAFCGAAALLGLKSKVATFAVQRQVNEYRGEPLLAILATMLEQLARLTRQVLDIVRDEKVCRRLMSVPGVGPITARNSAGPMLKDRSLIALNPSKDLETPETSRRAVMPRPPSHAMHPDRGQDRGHAASDWQNH